MVKKLLVLLALFGLVTAISGCITTEESTDNNASLDEMSFHVSSYDNTYRRDNIFAVTVVYPQGYASSLNCYVKMNDVKVLNFTPDTRVSHVAGTNILGVDVYTDDFIKTCTTVSSDATSKTYNCGLSNFTIYGSGYSGTVYCAADWLIDSWEYR